jgi:threonine aldolase
VFIDVAGVGVPALDFNEALKKHGTRGGAQGPTRIRFVTHLDVSRDQIHSAAEIVAAVASSLSR